MKRSQVVDTVTRYVDAWQKRDRVLWLSAFAEDAVQVDPVGSPANQGLVAIAAFWDRAMVRYSEIELHPGALHVCGNQAAMTWEIIGRDGASWVSFDGVDTFVFTEQARIASVRGYWRQEDKRRHASRPEQGHRRPFRGSEEASGPYGEVVRSPGESLKE